MSVQNRRKYDSDFKRNAVLLSLDLERSASQVAENLGISSKLLYRWRKEYRQCEELAFPDIAVKHYTTRSRSSHRKSMLESPVHKFCQVILRSIQQVA